MRCRRHEFKLSCCRHESGGSIRTIHCISGGRSRSCAQAAATPRLQLCAGTPRSTEWRACSPLGRIASEGEEPGIESNGCKAAAAAATAHVAASDRCKEGACKLAAGVRICRARPSTHRPIRDAMRDWAGQRSSDALRAASSGGGSWAAHLGAVRYFARVALAPVLSLALQLAAAQQRSRASQHPYSSSPPPLSMAALPRA